MTLLRTQLGNTLRGHRLRQRRTLRDVSGAARVSLGYLSEVERGQKEASSELLASICDALDVELADLLAEVSLELRGASAVRRPAPARPPTPPLPSATAPRGRAARRRSPPSPPPSPRSRWSALPARAALRAAARPSRWPPDRACSRSALPPGRVRRTCPVRTPAAGNAMNRTRAGLLDGAAARVRRRTGCGAARCSRSPRPPASPRRRSTTTSGPRTTSPRALLAAELDRLTAPAAALPRDAGAGRAVRRARRPSRCCGGSPRPSPRCCRRCSRCRPASLGELTARLARRRWRWTARAPSSPRAGCSASCCSRAARPCATGRRPGSRPS